MKTYAIFLLLGALLALPAGAAGPVPANQPAAIVDVAVDEETYREEPASSASPRLSDGARGRGTVDVPEAYWDRVGYPEDVSFAFQAGGELLDDGSVLDYWIIGLVDAGQDRQQELLDLLSPSCAVTFASCDYPYAARTQALAELQARQDPHITDLFLGRNTQWVHVVVEDGFGQEYTQLLEEEYGPLVNVLEASEVAYDYTLTDSQPLPTLHQAGRTAAYLGRNWWAPDRFSPGGLSLWTMAAAAAALVLVVLGRWRLPALGLSSNAVAVPRRLSRRQTAQVLRDSRLTPPPGTLAAIWDRLEADLP